jgi:hypothetical protein
MIDKMPSISGIAMPPRERRVMSMESGSQGRSARIMLSLLAIVLLILAFVLSVLLIPMNFQEPGALFWSALLLCIGLLCVPIFRIRFSDVRTFLYAENFVLLGLIYFVLLDLLQVSYPLTSVEVTDVQLAFLAIVVMAMGLWTGLATRAWQLPRPLMNAVTLQFRTREIFLAIWICFALGCFYHVYASGFILDAVLKGVAGGRWDAPWSRGQFGNWNAFLEHLGYFGYVLPSLTVLLALSSPRPHWARPRVIIAMCLSAIFVLLLAQSGSRRLVGVVLGGAMLTWIGMQPRIKLKHMLLSASIIVLMLYALQGILNERRHGLGAVFEGITLEGEGKSWVHVDDNFMRLTQIVSLMPEPFEYVGYKPFLYLLTRPIPRVLWPDKPSDAGYDLPSMVGLEGSGGTSLASSIVGEFYASWGLLAVFLGGIFYGKLASMWNRMLFQVATPNSKAIYGMGVMVLFASLRSMQELLLMSYAILGWMLLSSIFRKVWRRATPSLSQSR